MKYFRIDLLHRYDLFCTVLRQLAVLKRGVFDSGMDMDSIKASPVV